MKAIATAANGWDDEEDKDGFSDPRAKEREPGFDRRRKADKWSARDFENLIDSLKTALELSDDEEFLARVENALQRRKG